MELVLVKKNVSCCAESAKLPEEGDLHLFVLDHGLEDEAALPASVESLARAHEEQRLVRELLDHLAVLDEVGAVRGRRTAGG